MTSFLTSQGMFLRHFTQRPGINLLCNSAVNKVFAIPELVDVIVEQVAGPSAREAVVERCEAEPHGWVKLSSPALSWGAERDVRSLSHSTRVLRSSALDVLWAYSSGLLEFLDMVGVVTPIKAGKQGAICACS